MLEVKPAAPFSWNTASPTRSDTTKRTTTRSGEWREGTSPSRSLRTVRDSLPSYGSHSPALG